MPEIKPWTAERVAARVRDLVAEHGAPNRFQLHEIAGDVDRAAVLAVSRVARLQWWAVNNHLSDSNLTADYQVRSGAHRPACITVAATS